MTVCTRSSRGYGVRGRSASGVSTYVIGARVQCLHLKPFGRKMVTHQAVATLN
jgi:hypothetical protein